MAKTSKNTEIVHASFHNPIFDSDINDTLDVLRENLGESQAISLGDLDRLKVPNGSKTFIVPSLDGEQSEQEVTGIVVLARPSRAYWPTNAITEEPPVCFSDDGVVGVGEPGGACATCPMAQFGSAVDYVEGVTSGNSQACKQSMVLFLLTEDGFLPKVLRLPPTSLKAWRQYAMALTGRLLKFTDVITEFTIEVKKNDAGQPYSSVTPRFGGRLDSETRETVARLAEVMLPKLRSVRVAPLEVEDVEAAG